MFWRMFENIPNPIHLSASWSGGALPPQRVEPIAGQGSAHAAEQALGHKVSTFW